MTAWVALLEVFILLYLSDIASELIKIRKLMEKKP
jgi:hypothetical protein